MTYLPMTSGATRWHLSKRGSIVECEASSDESCPQRAYGHWPSQKKAEEALKEMYGSIPKPHMVPERSSIDYDGTTAETRALLSDLDEEGDRMFRYMMYRQSGLNEEKYIPSVNPLIEPYVNNEMLREAWRRRAYSDVVMLTVDGYKSYYLNKRFSDEDVDVMPSDEELRKAMKSHLVRMEKKLAKKSGRR